MNPGFDLFFKYERDIRMYLDSKADEGKNRELSSDEMAYVVRLGHICREFTRTRSKINFVNLLLDYIEDRDTIYPVKRNLFTISSSLERQKNLVYSVRMRFLEVKPEKKYIPALTELVHRCEKRIDYVNNTPLKAAIDLTPLKEYIELIGEPAFNKWVISLFGCEEDVLKAEVENVLNILKSKKLDKLYLERLHAYSERDEEIRQKAKEDKLKEREDRDRKVQNDNLELLFSIVCKREREIDMLSTQSAVMNVSNVTKKFPDQPIYLVAIGYTYNDIFQFKYLKNKGGMCTGMQVAKVFFSEKDAKDAATEYMINNPKKAAVALCVRKEQE